MAKLIQCFSYVLGSKAANDLIKDLNRLKSDKNTKFTLHRTGTTVADSMEDTILDRYCIKGKVTQNDWDELNLESDFMTI